MISKTFVTYAVMALSLAPSSIANPITPSDTTSNATSTAITSNAGHSSAPPDLSADVAATGLSLEKHPTHEETGTAVTNVLHPLLSPSSPTSVGNALNETAINAASVAHSPAPPLNHSSTTTPTANHSSTTTPPANHSSTTTPPLATNASSTPGAHVPNSRNNSHDAIATPPKKAPATEPELPVVPSCFNVKKSNGIKTHHCEKALEKVVYAANQTLDRFSSLIFANYKTCNINIYKPKNVTLTKIEVASMVRRVTEACHSVGGEFFKTSKIAVKVEHGDAKNTYEVDTSICQKEECPLTLGDCLSAFHQIPLHHESQNGTRSFSRVTSGNCTVTISTTDYSSFHTSRANVYPTMRKLFDDCGRHPGKIYLPGGSTGLNGDLKISTRAANRGLCD